MASKPTERKYVSREVSVYGSYVALETRVPSSGATLADVGGHDSSQIRYLKSFRQLSR